MCKIRGAFDARESLGILIFACIYQDAESMVPVANIAARYCQHLSRQRNFVVADAEAG